MKKIIYLNIFIFLIIIILFEAIFGKWFLKYNFGIHMSDFVNDKTIISRKINNSRKEFIFSRNSMGFRNDEIDASKINAVFLGGSTTIEKYLERKDTIVGILNKMLKDKEVTIANAGKEGKSSYGYLCDFKYWFPKIKDFDPDYYIFYTGLNDGWRAEDSLHNNCKHNLQGTYKESKIQNFRDYIKNSSIFYSFVNKIKEKYDDSLPILDFSFSEIIRPNSTMNIRPSHIRHNNEWKSFKLEKSIKIDSKLKKLTNFQILKKITEENLFLQNKNIDMGNKNNDLFDILTTIYIDREILAEKKDEKIIDDLKDHWFRAYVFDNDAPITYYETKLDVRRKYWKMSQQLEYYKLNLERLKKVFSERKISPIFITQRDIFGNTGLTGLVNQITKEFSLKNNYILIKLDEELTLDPNNFYDITHVNELGSKKIAEYIYGKIENLF